MTIASGLCAIMKVTSVLPYGAVTLTALGFHRR